MNRRVLQALIATSILLASSLAGCLDSDDSDDPTVIASTYHVGQIAAAIGGSSIDVQILSPSNVPVHDYEPSANDILTLGTADLFLYHGLGLEPWVKTTLDAMGEDKPRSISTHAMPTGEVDLDYESLLIMDLCEHLSEGPYENSTLEEDRDHADDVELHADHVVHTLTIPEEEHDEHGDDHSGHDDHSDHDDHSGEEDGHEGHNHGTPMETITSPKDCPAGTVIYIFELGEGEYVLEFESDEDVDEFNMVALKMLGGHAHHDHGDHGDDHSDHGDDHSDHGDDHSDHGDDDHSDHGDDDHSDHGDDHSDDDEEMTPEVALQMFDTDNDSSLSWDEFWASWEEGEDDGHENHSGTHDEHEEEEMSMLMEIFNESDADNNSLLNITELEVFIEHIHELDADDAAYAVLHIEEEGEYGFALPASIDFHILMGEGAHDDHSDHDDHGDDDHSDHGDDDHSDHDDHGDDDHSDHDDHGDDHDDHDDHGDDHDDHDDHADKEIAFDPHSWLDPLAYKAQVNRVLEEMKATFPDLADTFQTNAEAYMLSLDALHLKYETTFGESGTCEKNTVVSNHNAYSYMSQRYGMEFVTVHGLDPEGEPSAADILEVVEQIEEDGITIFYIEEYTDESAVDSIVEQTKSSTLPNGVEIQILYTMELQPKDSSDDYLSLMEKNLDALKSGLGC